MISPVGRRGFLARLAALPTLCLPAFGLITRSARADDAVIDGQIHEVGMKGLAFAPARIEARVGDGIRWTNADLVPHTATATDKSWDTGPIKKGESVTVEVTEGLTGTYKCKFHPHMLGEIVVIA